LCSVLIIISDGYNFVFCTHHYFRSL